MEILEFYPPYSSSYDSHDEVWQSAQRGELHTVHGIPLRNVQIGDVSQRTLYGTAPANFSIQGNYRLYEAAEVKVESFYSLDEPGMIHYVVTVPGNRNLSVGTLLPFLNMEPFNAIQLSNTKFVYRSQPTETEEAGLVVSTTILFSGPLEFINTILHDVFRQKNPHIEFMGLLNTHPDGICHHPQPLGFTLRGFIDDMDVNIFDLIKITKIGIDVTWIRRNSLGDYDHAYAFFGSGSIDRVSVEWHLSKYHDTYSIVVVTQSETWENLGGIPGVNIENVMLRGVWVGKASQLSLQLQCTMALGHSTLVLEGSYSSDGFEVFGSLQNFSLHDLQHLYERLFDQSISIDTSHDVVFSEMSIRIATGDGVSLSGAVTIDGHVAARATITLNRSGITILGGIDSLSVCDVEIISPSINVTISRNNFSFCLSGQVRVHKQLLTASIYLGKSSDDGFEYTVYGSFDGSLNISQMLECLEGHDFLDVTIEGVVVCISNADKPHVPITSATSGSDRYDLQKGFSVYIKAAAPSVVKGLLQLEEMEPIEFHAYCDFESCTRGELNFEIALQLPTGRLLQFDGVKCTSLSLGIVVSNSGPGLMASADLSISLPEQHDPLKLKLKLTADILRAEGSAAMSTPWRNPFGLCEKLTINSLYAAVGANYEQLVSTGLPSKLELSGHFIIGDFKGDFDMSIASDSIHKLLDLRIENLNVMKLIQLISHCLDVRIHAPQSSDVFYIHRLRIYISTGMTFNRKYYRKGVHFDADLTVFGKNVNVLAELNEKEVAFKGKIDSFKLGTVEVYGVDERSGPQLEFEVSATKQQLIVKGTIKVNRDKVSIDIDANVQTRRLSLKFELQIVDTVTVFVEAKLNGEMSQITHGTGRRGASQSSAGHRGGDLEGRYFHLHAEMDQHILERVCDYIISEFGDEGVAGFIKEGLETIRHELLVIDSITIDADGWKVGGRLEARIECTIANLSHSFSVDFYISNFVGEFVEKMRSVLDDTCRSVKEVIEEIEHDFEQFVELADKEIISLTSDCKLKLEQASENLDHLGEDLVASLVRAGVEGADWLQKDMEGSARETMTYKLMIEMAQGKSPVEAAENVALRTVQDAKNRMAATAEQIGSWFG